MLIRKHDAPIDENEWRQFLLGRDFGELVAAGSGRDFPVIVPTHFVYDGESTIVLHLAKANPVWPALAENPRAVVSVFSAYAYIPTDVNGDLEEQPYGVPTSYYAAVQAAGECEILDGDALAPILQTQLDHFQPDRPHPEVEAGPNPYGRLFGAIRGIRMNITTVRAKFKFGGNKTVEHQIEISKWLESQPGQQAAEAREHQQRRLLTKASQRIPASESR